MIRPILPNETPTLVAMARGTAVFKPMEIQALQEVLDDYHARAAAGGHRGIAFERDGHILGFAYFAAAAMTDRTWSLWWIVVDRPAQASGVGSELLRHIESVVRDATGRQILIETSSLPHYDLTRRFYLKHGYSQVAVIPNYYADGDDMLIFAKRLT